MVPRAAGRPPYDPVRALKARMNRTGFPGGHLVRVLRGDRYGLKLGMVGFLRRWPDVADRLDASLGEALGIANAHILRSSVRMPPEAAASEGAAPSKGLLQGMEGAVSRRARYAQATTRCVKALMTNAK